ncbi:Restriction of telomere capping protein 5 [Spathaspora sp. JA1]|nr:Restriction of telomere capping protein 5 [Spathaspora sp. JA1]
MALAITKHIIRVLPQKFLGRFPLFIGAELILGITILNKASGIYGILSLLTGHPINFWQWLFNAVALVMLPIYISAFINISNQPKNIRKMSIATVVYMSDTVIGLLYTLYFMYFWFYIEETPAPGTTNAKKRAAEEFDFSSQSASPARELFLTFALTIVVKTVRVYFTLVMMSFTRALLKQHLYREGKANEGDNAEHLVDVDEQEILGSVGFLGEIKKTILDLETKSKELLIQLSVGGTMGQSSSSSAGSTSQQPVEQFTKDQLNKLFYARCISLLKPIELAFLRSNLNIDPEQDQISRVITKLELASLLKLAHTEEDLSKGVELSHAIDIVYKSLEIIGGLPFLENTHQGLSLEGLVVGVIFYSGRYKKIFNTFDFMKLFYLSLVLPEQSEASETGSLEGGNQEIGSGKEGGVDQETSISVEMLLPIQPEDSPELKAKKVNWSNLPSIALDVPLPSLSAAKFQSVITLLLIQSSINKQAWDVQIETILSKWDQFTKYSKYLSTFLNLNIKQEDSITFEQFQTINNLIPDFIPTNLLNLMTNGIISTRLRKRKSIPEPLTEPMTPPPTSSRHKFPEFVESKLVNPAFLAYVSLLLARSISPQNVVKLYAGSESGFSIRSLESKIFKWQAPTLFIISGKRLKSKTITTNKRYQTFDHEYPRYFRTSEQTLRPWQVDGERVTYAVYVNSPWKNSNKVNFGDEQTTILKIQPHADKFSSLHNSVILGKSIYFNSLGMGIGFGNSQPLNKNGTRKYFPGDVSLTIEANLEFAIFRHVLQSSSPQVQTYFDRSVHQDIRNEQYEDRFIITDLEVWGVGSFRELVEQQREWEWETQQAEARQSVNIRSLGEERAFLEMAGLVGNHGSGGSV